MTNTRPLLAPTTVPEGLRRTCGDTSLPLWQRLEALEDVTESEVGDTPLIRARGLERRYGLRQLFLKVEGDNPTGTQKDRIALAQVYDALRQGYTGVCFATCGNYGVAMAWAARVPRIRCVAVVPETYRAPRIAQIAALGAEVVRLGDDYEGAVIHAQRLAREQELYDANPGGDNELIQLNAYKQIAEEIYDELRDAPAIVAAPVSNGTCLAGIYKGFLSLDRRGRTSRVPQMFAGSAYRKNPIVGSFKAGLRDCRDLPPDAIRETPVNEPLINWHAIDGQAALDAVWNSGGAALDITDKRMRELAKELRQEQGLMVQPASTAGLAALLRTHEKRDLAPDRYVAVLTGRSE
jgi:threonine synthase